MDGMDEIRLRMHISKLEAQLALREIECLGLNREIEYRLTPFKDREKAQERLDKAKDKYDQLKHELEQLRLVYPDIRH